MFGNASFTMPITITALSTPPMAASDWRDMRVRWALEGVGERYAIRLVSFCAMKEEPHLAFRSTYAYAPTVAVGPHR